ncbi:hypothetical protein N0V84_011941 [Fusarium piperis]|uniref:Uncharacterized protein n=1 Tax=Fusarium piperis TaxID=1435070 RepID=A0A9W8TCE4_9HYPO|nr:hypothetical protein N0V84_011941 [Fusarium piperis]
MVILLAIPSKLAQLFPSIPTLFPKRTQEWQNGLCSCSPGSSCVLSLFLPDLLQQDNEVKARLGYKLSSEGYQINPVMEMAQSDISPSVETSPDHHGPSNTPVVGEK